MVGRKLGQAGLQRNGEVSGEALALCLPGQDARRGGFLLDLREPSPAPASRIPRPYMTDPAPMPTS